MYYIGGIAALQSLIYELRAFGPVLYDISGHVWDKDNNPVEGATITVNPASDAPIVLPPTGADGYYEAVDLSQDTYTITGLHPEYPFIPQEVTIENQDLDVSFYTMFGYVNRYGMSPPEAGINGVDVRITGGDYQPGFNITIPTTDDDSGNPGYYEKQGVGPGTYTIDAQNP